MILDEKPLGFYTITLSQSQKNYTVGEKELLGIIEGWKEYDAMLYDKKIIVYTNHLNLLYKNNSGQETIWW